VNRAQAIATKWGIYQFLSKHENGEDVVKKLSELYVAQLWPSAEEYGWAMAVAQSARRATVPSIIIIIVVVRVVVVTLVVVITITLTIRHHEHRLSPGHSPSLASPY